ncbi:MAG TPA: hypothetical protein VLW85_22125 [Myxococcales bacterium]|nr:hypothetical protein [Myxococcales bacterium]
MEQRQATLLQITVDLFVVLGWVTVMVSGLLLVTGLVMISAASPGAPPPEVDGHAIFGVGLLGCIAGVTLLILARWADPVEKR